MSTSWSTNLSEIVIGVVGVTGSGKSSFIKRLTQRDDITVGSGLASVTQDINQYRLEHDGKTYIIIDSPGFDDSDHDDEDIFLQLAEWMETSFRAGQRMNGLLYLHPICTTRQRGSEIRNLRMFKKLCGDDNFGNVVLGLTFCDIEPADVIARRRKELTEKPHWWGEMIAKGSQICEIPLERELCLDLLSKFVPKEKVTLKLQSEVVHKGISIHDTEAAKTIAYKQELDEIRAKERKEMAQLYIDHERRMQQANAVYHTQLALAEERFKSLQNRQRLQEQSIRLKLQIEEEFERKTRLRQMEDKAKEEEEAQEIAQLEALLQQTRVENDRLEREVEAKTELARWKPLLIKRMAALSNDYAALNQWSEAGYVAQRYKTYIWTKRPDWVPQDSEPLNELLCAYCDRCLKSYAPSEAYYVCEECISDKGDSMKKILGQIEGGPYYFCVCADCKKSGKECWDRRHSSFSERACPSIGGLAGCSRYNGTPTNVSCDKCGKIVGGLYLHCCTCNDDWDLCVSCWGKGETCKDKTHDIHIISQCPPDIKM